MTPSPSHPHLTVTDTMLWSNPFPSPSYCDRYYAMKKLLHGGGFFWFASVFNRDESQAARNSVALLQSFLGVYNLFLIFNLYTEPSNSRADADRRIREGSERQQPARFHGDFSLPIDQLLSSDLSLRLISEMDCRSCGHL